MTHTLTISGTLPGLNEIIAANRKKSYVGAKLKRDTDKIILWAIREHLHDVKIASPVHMAYTWYEPNRRRDKDNISAGGRKSIQDALVKSGSLQGDGWAHIEGFSDTFAVDKTNPRIVVIIEEVG